MREIVHVYPTDLEMDDLRHADCPGFQRAVAPDDECALCQQGICEQVEDVMCLQDPSCKRLVVHGLSRAKA
jgi:hypothetical protein